MRRDIPIPDVKEPTPDELAEQKRISDRRQLIDHIDYFIRPPAWVYEEMEEAIRPALEGNRTREIKSQDGCTYVVADLLDRWDLEDLLEVYRRPPDDPSYRDW